MKTTVFLITEVRRVEVLDFFTENLKMTYLQHKYIRTSKLIVCHNRKMIQITKSDCRIKKKINNKN